jgi:SpoIIAA-like
MIERITEMPAGTVGFRVAGQVEREDYRDVLVPELRRALVAGGGLRTLYLIDRGSGRDRAGGAVGRRQARLRSRRPPPRRLGALSDRHRLGLDGPRHRLFAWMIPGEARVFETAELDSAKQWVAGDAS